MRSRSEEVPMRLSRFSPWLAALAGCVASAFLACGSDVDDVPIGPSSSSSSGTGAAGASGGAGGASTSTGGPTSSVASTAASTAASSTSGNGGSGGVGTPCEEGCEKINTECGFGDLCSMIPQLDCGSAPGADCFGQCVLDADCDAIGSLIGNNPDPALIGCLTACQGGGQGGAGGGGGQGAGGGPGGDCLDCGTMACTNEGIACFQDNACGAWLQCLQGCNDAACVADCDANSPGGPASDAVKECACQACNMECSTLLSCQ